jgi:hypothetical protein
MFIHDIVRRLSRTFFVLRLIYSVLQVGPRNLKTGDAFHAIKNKILRLRGATEWRRFAQNDTIYLTLSRLAGMWTTFPPRQTTSGSPVRLCSMIALRTAFLRACSAFAITGGNFLFWFNVLMADDFDNLIQYLRELLIFQTPNTIRDKMPVGCKNPIRSYVARLFQATRFKIIIINENSVFVFDYLTGNLTED